MNKYVVIDLETTGHSPEVDDKIIELGLVVIEGDRIVDTYDTLLDPKRPIPDFISQLTGISQQDVQGAPTFAQIAPKIVDYFKDSYFIAHNVPFDLGFLNESLLQCGLEALNNLTIDTVELSRILLPQASSFKLNDLADRFEIEHDDPHRALSDAYVTAQLFLKLHKKLQGLPYETLKQLLRLESSLHSDLKIILQQLLEGKLYEDSQEDITVYKGLAMRTIETYEELDVKVEDRFSVMNERLFSEHDRSKLALEQLEYRAGQLEMAEIVYDAFQSSNHLLIEAGTGTGKSLAYLLPAVYEAVDKDETILVSTHTTHLQSQLISEANTRLKGLFNIPFQISLLKGKEHYINIERFILSLEDGDDNYDIALTKAIILVWLTETKTGDVDEIRLPSSGYSFFRKVSAQADRNIYQTETPLSLLHYVQARERARHSQILVVNHALLCTDIKHDYEILPSYDKVVIDEAHHLADVFSRTYGMKFSFLTIHHFLSDLNTSTTENKWFNYLSSKYKEDILECFQLSQWDYSLSEALYEIDEFFRYLYSFVKNNNEYKETYNDIGRLQLILQRKHLQTAEWESIQEFVRRICLHLRDLYKLLESLSIESFEQIDQHDIRLHMDRLNTFIGTFEYLFLSIDLEEDVLWFEIDQSGAKNIVYINCEPVSSAPLIQDQFFSQKSSVILTSATLTVRESFKFMQNKLGLEKDNCITDLIQSPFNYSEQVQLLIPEDFPAINEQVDEFIYASCEAIISLAEVTKGRMLVLFTAYDMLRKCYFILKESLDELDFNLIAQGVSTGSRTRLKKSFQTNPQTILLGTSSFWEGVDIPGEDLKAVVIVRLPFEPPNDPIYAAKATKLQTENKNAFYELALPQAVLRFKQGFGRLIRSKEDQGIIFVCDSRIKTARYSSFFLNSIPELPVTYAPMRELIHKAEQWLD